MLVAPRRVSAARRLDDAVAAAVPVPLLVDDMPLCRCFQVAREWRGGRGQPFGYGCVVAACGRARRLTSCACALLLSNGV